MSAAIHHKARQRDPSVGRVMIDAFGGETLTRLIHFHRRDGSDALQLSDDKVALDIRVRVGGMGDLKREMGQGQTRISRARPNPENAFAVGWTIGIQPEARGSPGPGVLGTREAQGPEPYVMALPGTVADRLLKPDVLATSEQIERAERGRWIGRVEHEGSDHAPGTGQA